MNDLDTVLRARRVITATGERAASVAVRDGVIVFVGEPSAAYPATRDLHLPDDVVLLPGLVDTHVHLQEPSPLAPVPLEGFASGSRAAAAGGITTVVDMPLDSVPVTVDVAALGVKRTAALAARPQVDVAFWGGAVPGNLGRLGELHRAGVVGLKCYLTASGHPDFAPLSRPQLREAMAEVASFDGLLAVHAEDHSAALTPGASTATSGREYRGFLAARPERIEMVAVAAVVDAVRRTGCRAHVVHVSSAGAADLIAQAQADGLPITAETCPHYLTIDADDVPDGATQFACNPPIRDRANAERLWAHLRAGTLSCVVSDHSLMRAVDAEPCDDFSAAPGGVVSLQLGLPVLYSAARARGCSLAEVARWMGSAPAALAGLARKGSIAVGFDADFCVFAPDETFVAEAAPLGRLTPYQGRRLTGVVRQTWLRGEPIECETDADSGPGSGPDTGATGRGLLLTPDVRPSRGAL